jgi:hypothetical protein
VSTEALVIGVAAAAETDKTAEEDEKEDDEQVEEEKTVELFCGSEGREESFCLRWYEVSFALSHLAPSPYSPTSPFQRGALTLALAFLPLPSSDDTEATLSWLDSRAERLLEAVESVLEVVVPPKPFVLFSLSFFRFELTVS